MMREKPLRTSMELFIETLAGTSMSLRVSPHDTVRDVKDYIQKLEGIPTSQQHLVWQASELEDNQSLQDCRVYNGARLRLVLNMRGGPVNTRHVPSEEPTLHEMAEYFAEASRSDLMSSSSSHHRPMTVVVCQSGSQFNFYRLVSTGDVAPSLPCSRNPSSDECADEDEELTPPVRERHEENNRTRDKMRAVRLRMETRKESRDKPPTVGPLLPRPPSAGRPMSCNRLRRMSNGGAAKFLPVSTLSRKACLPPVGSQSLVDVVLSPSSTDLHRIMEWSGPSSDLPADGGASGRVVPVDESPAAGMLLDPVDLNAFSKESAVIGGSDMCKIDDDSDVAGASSVDDKTRACTTVSAGESGPCDIGVDATMAAAAADVASVLSFTADELPCPPAVRSTASQKVVVDSGARASSARLRSSPEPFLDAKTNFASAVASALGETAATQRSTTLKMSTGGRGGGGNGSVVLRSLNSREMRAMSGILSTIVRGHSKGIVPRGSGTVVSACRLSDVTGTATSLKPAKETPGPIVDQTEPVNVLSRKLPAVQDGQPFDSPTLPCNIPPSSAVSVVESITAKTMTKRCTTCGKKTRLATSFSCRCGGNFCSVHRYAEVHGCTFDYKSEGRRLLEQSNPLVTAAKLPKI